MNIHRGLANLFLAGSFGALGLVGIMISSNAQAQNTSSEGGQAMNAYRSPYDRINDQAMAAKAGDETSMRNLVDQVLMFPSAYPPIPTPIKSIFEDRLFSAEMSYRQGKTPGVREQDIVSLINSLAERFGAPDYALTTANQMRHLRMQLILAEPEFMGAGAARPGGRVGESISSTMSPLQAAHLIGVLVTQKIIEPKFQVAPAEWDRTSHPIPQQGAKGASKQGQLTSSVRTREMREKFSEIASTLTLQDGLDMVDQVFATLGIGQGGGARP